jgi:hypothetical protein
MSISLSSARRLAAGAVGATAVAGAMLFGATPAANAAPGPAPVSVGWHDPAPLGHGGWGHHGGSGRHGGFGRHDHKRDHFKKGEHKKGKDHFKKGEHKKGKDHFKKGEHKKGFGHHKGGGITKSIRWW